MFLKLCVEAFAEVYSIYWCWVDGVQHWVNPLQKCVDIQGVFEKNIKICSTMYFRSMNNKANNYSICVICLAENLQFPPHTNDCTDQQAALFVFLTRTCKQDIIPAEWCPWMPRASCFKGAVLPSRTKSSKHAIAGISDGVLLKIQTVLENVLWIVLYLLKCPQNHAYYVNTTMHMCNPCLSHKTLNYHTLKLQLLHLEKCIFSACVYHLKGVLHAGVLQAVVLAALCKFVFHVFTTVFLHVHECCIPLNAILFFLKHQRKTITTQWWHLTSATMLSHGVIHRQVEIGS